MNQRLAVASGVIAGGITAFVANYVCLQSGDAALVTLFVLFGATVSGRNFWN